MKVLIVVITILLSLLGEQQEAKAFLPTFDFTAATNAIVKIVQTIETIQNQVKQFEKIKEQLKTARKLAEKLADGDFDISVNSSKDILDLVFEAKENLKDGVVFTQNLTRDYNNLATDFNKTYGFKDKDLGKRLIDWNENTKGMIVETVASQRGAVASAQERKKKMKDLIEDSSDISGDVQGIQILIRMVGTLTDQVRDLTILMAQDSKMRAAYVSEEKAKYEDQLNRPPVHNNISFEKFKTYVNK